jgi:hypothetical protein
MYRLPGYRRGPTPRQTLLPSAAGRRIPPSARLRRSSARAVQSIEYAQKTVSARNHTVRVTGTFTFEPIGAVTIAPRFRAACRLSIAISAISRAKMIAAASAIALQRSMPLARWPCTRTIGHSCGKSAGHWPPRTRVYDRLSHPHFLKEKNPVLENSYKYLE